jgi:hypothetical protein
LANDPRKDPRALQDTERAAQAQTRLTFAELCECYVEHKKASGKISWKTDEGYLKRPRAKFGKRPVVSISKRELMDFFETIARTSKSSANRTQSTVRTMWGWAADRDHFSYGRSADLFRRFSDMPRCPGVRYRGQSGSRSDGRFRQLLVEMWRGGFR